MKLLVAYDGSTHADRAIDDLRHAGLSNAMTAEVLAVADVVLPPRDPKAPVLQGVANAHEVARQAVHGAAALADVGASRLSELRPGWVVSTHAVADSPAWGIIKRAEETNVDLIVLGARGRGKLARLLMGSVSTAVVTEARCSVRVSRENAVSGLRTDYDPVNVLVAVDGSEHADRAVQEAANRHWPQGSTAVILAVIDARMAGAVDADLGRARALSGQGDGDSPLAWVDLLVSEAAATLSGAGLDVRPTVLQGDPKVEILRLAEEQAIDLIFLGARGLSRVERMLLGSISQGVVTRAPCTVEVVR